MTEAEARDGAFTAGPPRALDPADPLPPLPGGRPLDWWLDAASVTDRAAAAGW